MLRSLAALLFGRMAAPAEPRRPVFYCGTPALRERARALGLAGAYLPGDPPAPGQPTPIDAAGPIREDGTHTQP